jgi:hypothetical protein
MIALLVRYLEILVNEIQSINDRSPKEVHPNELDLITNKKTLCYFHSILAIKALKESVQGPCRKNQEAIGRSGFLVIANQILSLCFMYKKTNKEFYFTNYQICKLKSECTNLLLSLLEQRGINDNIVIDMRQYLNEEVLLNNMIFVFYMFTLEKYENYQEDLLFTVYPLLQYSHIKKVKDLLTLN